MSAVDPPFVAETLAWCNERRAERNLPPLDRLPKGRRVDGRSCPCGSATGLHVAAAYYFDPDGGDEPEEFDLPQAVVEFVKAFDECGLPQYDMNPICSI